MDEKLVFWECLCELEVFFASGGVQDPLRASFEGSFELFRESVVSLRIPCSVSYYWDDLSRLVVKSMRQMLVEGDKVRNIDVAVVLFGEHILSYLIPRSRSENLSRRRFRSRLTGICRHSRGGIRARNRQALSESSYCSRLRHSHSRQTS